MESAAAGPRSSRLHARRRLRRAGAVALLSLIGLGAIDIGGAVATASANRPADMTNAEVGQDPRLAPEATTQQNVFTHTNNHRRANGARDVRYNYALTVAAQRHANEMARRNRMTHTGANGSNAGQRITAAGFRWTSYGENVAVGQTSSSAVVYAWMNSSGHRANLLNPRFQWMGVGLAWGQGRIWWCVVLARG